MSHQLRGIGATSRQSRDRFFELAINADFRQPGISRLLQTGDQLGADKIGGEDVGVEIVAFGFPRVGDENAPDAQRGQHGPQAFHHFGARHGQEEIHRRARRRGAVQVAFQLHRRGQPYYLGAAERAIYHPNAQGGARRGVQHFADVARAVIG